MRKKPYLPKKDKKLEEWLNCFAIEIKDVIYKLELLTKKLPSLKTSQHH
jgi:hypothetical protein